MRWLFTTLSSRQKSVVTSVAMTVFVTDAAQKRTRSVNVRLSRDQGFMTENKRRIMIGSYVLSSGFFDAYYLQAQKARTLLINEFNELLNRYDVLVSAGCANTCIQAG